MVKRSPIKKEKRKTSSDYKTKLIPAYLNAYGRMTNCVFKYLTSRVQLLPCTAVN
jgi:hypothetical protein